MSEFKKDSSGNNNGEGQERIVIANDIAPDKETIEKNDKTQIYKPSLDEPKLESSSIRQGIDETQQGRTIPSYVDITRYQIPNKFTGDDRTRLLSSSNYLFKKDNPNLLKEPRAAVTPVNFVLKERFLMEKVLGVGGMGVVYRAKDKLKVDAQDKDPYVAIKVLNDDFKSHPESFIALQRESRKTQRLSHPNIVKVFDFDKDGDLFFMTMEYMEGQPLDYLINNQEKSKLHRDDVWTIIRGMCSALSYAHTENIIHADLKPGNIFITANGMAKIFDFGIARAVTNIDRSGSRLVDKTLFDAGSLGALTPAYASYEMLKGREPDVKDDIYALGCIIYELLTGKHPFNKVPADEAKDKNLKPVRISSISKRQWKAIEKSLSFERKDRIATADELYRQLTLKQNPRNLLKLSLVMMIFGGVTGYFYLQGMPEDKKTMVISESDIRDEVEFKIRFEFFKEELERLLESQNFGDDWEDSVWEQFRSISDLLPKNDSWLMSTKNKIYSLYLNKIQEDIVSSRFTHAAKHISNAYRYTNDISLLKNEELKLAEAIKNKHAVDLESAITVKKQAVQIQIEKQHKLDKNIENKNVDTNIDTQRVIDEYNHALSNVNKQLECQSRLKMRDFDIAINKLKSLDMARYINAEKSIITSLAACIIDEAKTLPERAIESKKYALRIFDNNELLAAINIVPRDTCDLSIAGLGSRGSRAICRDKIKGLGDGPELVVVPAGEKIRSFAIGKHETSISEFKRYCTQTNKCSLELLDDEGIPVTNQSIAIIKEYIAWLKEMTGNKYRLPTKDEWVYASTSETIMQDPNRNCQFSSRGIQKGDGLQNTTIGKQNSWGLVNYLGNAQELAYDEAGKLVAMGGAYVDSMNECQISTWKYHSGQSDNATGFRVVREITSQ